MPTPSPADDAPPIAADQRSTQDVDPQSNPRATGGFDGLAVAAFESRRRDEMQRMIEKHGGRARVSPSMQESPLDDARPAIEFAHRLLAGQVDAMILLTGVGTRMFVERVERHVGRDKLLDALSDIPTLARGPKPVAAMREFGLKPSMRAPAPNTWREVLSTLDRELPVANLTVGLQEYGVTNPSLVAGLEARGARVERVRVYEWALPDDTEPLLKNARQLAAGETDVALFTSANQVTNLLMLAERDGFGDELVEGLRRAITASIGPTTSERLRDLGLQVDFEATSGVMGKLVMETAQHAHELIRRKRALRAIVAAEPAPAHGAADADRLGVLRAATAGQPWGDSDFLRACRLESVERTPVWLMRQAGRYMSEYRAVRKKVGFLELCKNPQLCSEVMCTAVDFLGVDAAIIFSDLLPILEPMGMELEFAPGDGPVIHNPLREGQDVDRLVDLESVDALHYVVETVRQTRADLPERLPLIGFAGAPFTLASYAIEGGGSRNYLHTKTLMLRDEGAWAEIMRRLARAVRLYLNAQIAAGAQAVQLFDSWVGCLDPAAYERYVLPYTQELIAGLDPRAVVIHFGAGNPELLPLIARAGGDVVGVDWRVPLADAWRRVGAGKAVQGNLDPATLLADRATLERRAGEILTSVAGRPGHVFNLGHGIVPQTPPENARALVDFVHNHPVE
ncbi:Uroporphyrinogen decarboxylase [Pseudobythopirellula maris]|uniref:Uroporphyrinogen decarboxylase n=1 Tax=Pseudobythopirellula maris TaxID=2527991 RepID=A0A5C5ZUD1_9BACT|nr:uroporphyrinogen decarboxylase [Pseudobythopirellula maris]TWT91142.1 Uroporphyrinogen decarboxylase [Pseudobythopirellula maris]